ncbi:MAG: GHKL domain-containing protein [Burkholderiaceae bacterium]|nr:GHKL domain-containing protein [Burkholderiaceae bacterium]
MNRLLAWWQLRQVSRRLRIFTYATLFAAVLAISYFVGARVATQNVVDASTRQLQILSGDVESILERYESLPYSLSVQSSTALALQHPNSEASQRLNQILSAVQSQAKVAAIYLMNKDGETIATSNWNTPQSYINKNFGFRPYFIEAMQGRTGRFYGIGSTTAEPGYFIAQPVYAEDDPTNDATAFAKDSATVLQQFPAISSEENQEKKAQGYKKPIGVLAVKISLKDFSTAWRGIVEPIALVDKWGVIFLSNRSEWQYRSLGILDVDAQQEMQKSLQYVGQVITPLAAKDLRLASTSETELKMAISRKLGRLDWRLLMLPNQNAINRSAGLWALGAALIMLCLGLWLRIVAQRQRQLEERGLARAALQAAADELEHEIAKRTMELTEANQSIAVKYAKLKETEQLLRVTQNELVQAGKLTMLGQMAAGVTHELNQPLTAIRAFSENAATFLERGEPQRAQENLRMINAASARMGSIIAQLKGFGERKDNELDDVVLAQVIYSAAKLLENDFDTQKCALHIFVQDEVSIKGDAVRIEQVLINLLKNALDASEKANEKLVTVKLEKQKDKAVITIEDRGEGLTDMVAAKLFEPFFTTKESGKGLGLGLAISSSIIQAMNGSLLAKNRSENNTELGAMFILTLPIA